ncbi:hypothetical protein AMTR_s00012p00169450 [Amborella trichopoda]|uniref:Prenyltransferase alpha-alpha toroid domain-containing protein n=2 Tax=Amborella trichopoda TaxID=13333 RepID=W1PJI1_AMBTC|nr:hypothetical protein AMTR_s00012p00169450 [Amborella trichopoda]
MVDTLPYHYQREDIHRLTLAYFAVSGLAILNALDRVDKERLANWVLSLQVIPREKQALEHGHFFGFCGSSTFKLPIDTTGVLNHNGSHLASTYCALAILKMIGHEFSTIVCEFISTTMKCLQQPDGSFMSIRTGAETDLRFVFCAAAISSMLNDWSGLNKIKAKDYILSCQSYDGGFGLIPGAESHGGATYCAISALRLMGFIDDNFVSQCTSSVIDMQPVLEWSLQRQTADGGFQGRPNKASDTCYAFWVGGVLRMLGADHFDKNSLREFLLTCQSKFGGFSKHPWDFPDLYHSYYGVCAFSLLQEPGLVPLCFELGMPEPFGI